MEANGTKLEAGIKVVFSLTMDIPLGTYAEDVKVELYAEEGNFTFGILCPPSVTQTGSNIVYETATPSYDYDADNPFMVRKDWAAFHETVMSTSSPTFHFNACIEINIRFNVMYSNLHS